MDAYSPLLISLGETGMIGKGKRGPEVIAAMKEHGAVYFGAIGGCGALHQLPVDRNIGMGIDMKHPPASFGHFVII
mgnify:CR=1 FL=1